MVEDASYLKEVALKKTLWSVVAILFVLGALACSGGGKYGEAKSLMEKQIASLENYVGALEKAGSAADVAAAFNKYADDMKTMGPAMKALLEKYPDLKSEKEPPAELKPLMAKMEELTKRIGPATMKVAQYLMDPAVQEAQKKFMEAASSIK
jgi:hypothetical protein